MNVIIDFFSNNPTILVSIIVFFICVIIGFFGDQYLKKNKVSTESVAALNNGEDTGNLNETKETVDNAINNVNDTNNMADVNYSVDNNISLGNSVDTNYINNTIEANQYVNNINSTNNIVDTNYNANGVNYVDNNIEPSQSVDNISITNNVVDTDYMLNNSFMVEPNTVVSNDTTLNIQQEKNSDITQSNEISYINNDDNYTNMF